MKYYEPVKNMTQAYHKDSSGNEYFGMAARGATTAKAVWVIYRIKYTGDNWIIEFAEGTDAPKFIWDSVESYTYSLLGT